MEAADPTVAPTAAFSWPAASGTEDSICTEREIFTDFFAVAVFPDPLPAEGDFDSWSEDLPTFFLVSLVGLALLPVVRWLTDKVLLPTVKLADEIAMQEKPNVGAAYIEAISYIAAALIITWCV